MHNRAITSIVTAARHFARLLRYWQHFQFHICTVPIYSTAYAAANVEQVQNVFVWSSTTRAMYQPSVFHLCTANLPTIGHWVDFAKWTMQTQHTDGPNYHLLYATRWYAHVSQFALGKLEQCPIATHDYYWQQFCSVSRPIGTQQAVCNTVHAW